MVTIAPFNAKHGSHPLFDQCLRLTIGTPEENEQLLSALVETLAEC